MKQSGGAHWEFALANGKQLGVSARLCEDWLLLDAPLTEGVARRGCWDLLRLNATLQGLSKFVMTTDARLVHLRADIPLPEDEDSESDCESEVEGVLTTRLLETCAGLKAASQSFRGEKTSDRQALTSLASSEDQAEHRSNDLRRLCADAGWQFIERSAGKLMVELDVRGGFYQAAVEHQADGAHISVEIVRSETFGETSRQALGRLLLGTGALLRLARPSIEEKDNEIAVRFEVRFATMPTAIELTRAFASLSVACAMSGREARALQDEVIAGDYLAILGAQSSLQALLGSGD